MGTVLYSYNKSSPPHWSNRASDGTPSSHWHLQSQSDVRFEGICMLLNIPWPLVTGWASHLLPMVLAVVAHTSHLRIFVVIGCWGSQDHTPHKFEVHSKAATSFLSLEHLSVHFDNLEQGNDKVALYNEEEVQDNSTLSWKKETFPEGSCVSFVIKL